MPQSLFTQNISAITRPGVYLVAGKSPTSVKATGTGVAALVCQTPWGPPAQIITPASDGDRNLTYAPPGFNRTATGILAMIEKAWPLLKVARVLGPTAAIATASFPNGSALAIVVCTLKYAGADGNSAVGTISAASDGNSNHFKLTVTVTGASGTSAESFDNLNASGTGADYLGADKWTASLLVGSITKSNAGIPVAASVSFTSGTNGTITSAEYVGTAGNADKGIALLEGDSTIRQFCTDDCGSSFRAAVNAGIKAHGIAMGDRIGVMSDDSGQTAAHGQAAVASSLQDVSCIYADPWCREYDDVTGALQLVPPTSFIMSAMAQTPPSLRIAWRGAPMVKIFGGIISLEFNRGQGAAANTAAGITTIIPGENGGFVVELDVTTATALDATLQDVPRQRMGIYVGTALKKTFPSVINGPNVPFTQDDIVAALTSFLDGLKNNAKEDPFNLPYIIDYQMGQITSVNTPTSLSNGFFKVPVDIKTDAGLQKLIFNITYGSTVNITVSGSGA